MNASRPRGDLLAFWPDDGGVSLVLSVRGVAATGANGQSLPNPRGGSIAWSPVRSRSQISRSASAVEPS